MSVVVPAMIIAPASIPFAQPVATTPSGLTGLWVAVVLLAVAWIALWYVRRSGRLDRWVGGIKVAACAGFTVRQRVRLSSNAVVHVLEEGEQRFLVVEHRHGLQVHPLPPREQDVQ